MRTNDGVQRLHRGRLHAERPRAPNRVPEDRLDLERPTLLEVDEHARPIRPQRDRLGEETRDDVVGREPPLAAASSEVGVGGRHHLAHCTLRQPPELLVAQDRGRVDTARGNAEPVEGHVPAQLLPASVTEARSDHGFQARASEEICDRLGLVPVVEHVPDGDTAVGHVADDAGARPVNADEGHDPEHPLGAKPLGERSLHVEAVHEGRDSRAGPYRGSAQLRCHIERGGLEGAEEDVRGRVYWLPVRDREHRREAKVAIGAVHHEPMLAKRLKLPPGNEDDLVPRGRQPGPVEQANGTGSHNDHARHGGHYSERDGERHGLTPRRQNGKAEASLRGSTTMKHASTNEEPASWITLGAASKLLGVSESTIRRWADRGEIRSYRTAGGHRRVAEEDVRRIVEHGGGAPTKNSERIETLTLARVRRRLARSRSTPQMSWLTALGEVDRERLRLLGRQLVDLFSRAIAAGTRADRYTADARAIGREYGRVLAGAGVGVARAVTAFNRLRHSLEETASQIAAESGLSLERTIEALEQVLGLADIVVEGMAEVYDERLGQAGSISSRNP